MAHGSAPVHAELRDAVNGIELYRANMIGADARTERRTAVPVQQIELTKDPFVSRRCSGRGAVVRVTVASRACPTGTGRRAPIRPLSLP